MDKDLHERLDKVLRKQAELQECLKISGEINRPPHHATPPPLPPQRAAVASPAPGTVTPAQVPQVEPTKALTPPVAAQAATRALPVAPEDKTTAEIPVLRKPAVSTGEWEINFGRVWLVRIGVLLLLTGLIFLSTYAYKNWLFNTGPSVRVAFFMVISLTLTGLGM